MKLKKVKIGIIGCGRVFEHYLKIFKKRKIRDYEIVAICEKKIPLLNMYSKKLHCMKFSNYQKMLKKLKNKIDLIIVLSPSGNHYKHSKLALENNFNVLCEKPATMMPGECLILNRLSQKKKLIFGVAFQNRFNKSVQTLSYLLKKKKFGKVNIVNIRLLWCRYQNYYMDEWHGKWKSDGGVTNQQAIHHIDVARWLFGPVKEVNSLMTNQINRLQAEDTNNTLIRYKNGAIGTVQLTTSVRPKDMQASIEVIGEKGFMVLGGIALNKIDKYFFKNLTSDEKKLIKNSNENVENGYGNSHKIIIDKMFNCITKKKRNFSINALESYHTENLIHAMYISDEKKKWVKVKKSNLSKRLGKK